MKVQRPKGGAQKVPVDKATKQLADKIASKLFTGREVTWHRDSGPTKSMKFGFGDKLSAALFISVEAFFKTLFNIGFLDDTIDSSLKTLEDNVAAQKVEEAAKKVDAEAMQKIEDECQPVLTLFNEVKEKGLINKDNMTDEAVVNLLANAKEFENLLGKEEYYSYTNDDIKKMDSLARKVLRDVLYLKWGEFNTVLNQLSEGGNKKVSFDIYNIKKEGSRLVRMWEKSMERRPLKVLCGDMKDIENVNGIVTFLNDLFTTLDGIMEKAKEK